MTHVWDFGDNQTDTGSGVTGWTLLDTAVSGTVKTSVYSNVADASDGGRTVRLALDAAAANTLTVAVHSGDIRTPRLAEASATRWTIVLPRAGCPVVTRDEGTRDEGTRDEGTRDEGARDAQTTRGPPGPDGDRSDGRDGSHEAPAPGRDHLPGPAPVRLSI